tara:strand:+ start:3992 stop:6184 length:2193 start_codon:yes stop_codon:yes gene_type:complete
MKKLFFTATIFLFFLIISLVLILSTTGFETNRFNELISSEAKKNNKNISLNLDRVKFKLDIKNFNLFLETKNPQLTFKNLVIPISNIKVYLNFYSLIKSKSQIDKINISFKEINVDELKKIVIKTKPSNLNSLIINKINDGKLNANLEVYLKENLELDNFIVKGEIREMSGKIADNIVLKDTSFNFFADSSDVLIKNVKSKMDGLKIKNGNFQIKKDKEIILKSDFITKIDISKKNFNYYKPIFKNFDVINIDSNFDAELNNYLDVTFDKTFKITKYKYSNKGKINKSNLNFKKSFKSPFLEKEIDNLKLKNSNFEIRYASDNKNYIFSNGRYSIDSKNYHKYDFKNDFLKDNSKIDLNFEFSQILNIDFINYKKKENEIANIKLAIHTNKDTKNIQNFQYSENKNQIFIEKLKINKRGFISLESIKVKTFNKNDLKNDFTLNFGKKITIIGNKYDAKNLNKYLNKRSKKNIFKRINKDINIDIKDIETPLSKKLLNFKLLGVIEKGKFIKISSKGDFGNNKFLDISMKSDKKNNRKFLEVYSDLPQPLLSEYKFFKGLTEGVLTFTSIIEENSSTSILVIDNFKVVNAPGMVKLLSLADFGGLADLAEGEGLSFEKLEIKMDTNRGFLNLRELYAVGPSISVLMEGYKEQSGLTSLRGTLVPAKNLNKLLSKIPVIGKIIIPKDIGEGLFGVSFKIKGMPGKMKTTINPIKTLTPRFITKALEKQKKPK